MHVFDFTNMAQRIIILCFLLSGCYSLPEQIAVRCSEKVAGDCSDQARCMYQCLKALNYRGVIYKSGRVLPGDQERHAWVEFRDSGEIYVLDSQRLLLGRYLWKRSDLRSCEYVATMAKEFGK